MMDAKRFDSALEVGVQSKSGAETETGRKEFQSAWIERLSRAQQGLRCQECQEFAQP